MLLVCTKNRLINLQEPVHEKLLRRNETNKADHEIEQMTHRVVVLQTPFRLAHDKNDQRAG